MTDENCCKISKEIIRSTTETVELAKRASQNAKDMEHKLQKFATEIEQISYDCENSKNENKTSLSKIMTSEKPENVPEKRTDGSNGSKFKITFPEIPVMATNEAINHSVNKVEKEKSFMAAESPSKLVYDETNIADNKSYEEPTIAVEKNKLTDLISTLEETKDALSSMQDCCVESSNKANGLLKKAYQKAQDINGSTSTIWPFGGKKSIAAITTTGLKTEESGNWFEWLSRKRKDSLNGSKSTEEIHPPNKRATLSRLYVRFGEIVCSEEMTYFAAGLSFGIATAYMTRYVTSKNTKKVSSPGYTQNDEPNNGALL